jgi:hypothetical protein
MHIRSLKITLSRILRIGASTLRAEKLQPKKNINFFF